MVDAELSYADIAYAYTYPGYDQTDVVVKTPLLVSSAAQRVTDVLSVGIFLMPVPGGTSRLKVDDLPSRLLSDEPGLIDIATSNGKKFGYVTALGGTISLPIVELGVALRASESHSVLEISDGETEAPIVSARWSTQAIGMAVGARSYLFKSLQVGGTYHGRVATRTAGRFDNEGGEEFDLKSSSGDRFSGSVAWVRGAFRPFAEATYRRDKTSRGEADPLAATSERQRELYDVTELATGATLRLTPQHSLTGGFGWYPSSVGNGTMASDGGDELAGIQFGDLDAVSVQMFGVGARSAYGGMAFTASASLQQGRREVPESSRGQGVYEVSAMTASLGVAWQPEP
jgi:hypothetical protein